MVLILKVIYHVRLVSRPLILAVLVLQARPYVSQRLLNKINIPQRARRPFLMSSVTHSQLTICNSHLGFEGSRALTRENFPFEGKILLEQTYDYIYINGLVCWISPVEEERHLKLIRVQKNQVLFRESFASCLWSCCAEPDARCNKFLGPNQNRMSALRSGQRSVSRTRCGMFEAKNQPRSICPPTMSPRLLFSPHFT